MIHRIRKASLSLAFLCCLALSGGPQAQAQPANPCNPCGENPCNPCYGNPCGGNPCGDNPCGANPCGGNPCGGDPWADGVPPEIYEGDEGLRRLIELRRSLDETKESVGDETLRETVEREERQQQEVERRVLGRARPTPAGHPHDAWARLLRVTHDNPLVSEECRLDAVEKVGTHFADHRGGDPAVHYLEQQRDYVAATRGGQDALTREIISHIENCPDFCLPFLGHLLRCHVDAVAASEPTIVFFPVDVAAVSDRFVSALDTLAAEVLSERRNVILFGSASNLGHTPMAYDENLSLRRAISVKNELVAAGVPIERIRVKWLGWQEPRLSGRRLAQKWGVEERLERMLKLEYMNQNVVAVAY